jgi:hypothetical protein
VPGGVKLPYPIDQPEQEQKSITSLRTRRVAGSCLAGEIELSHPKDVGNLEHAKGDRPSMGDRWMIWRMGVLVAMLAILLYSSSCMKDVGGTEPGPPSSDVPQQHITWASLADVPWPAARHDAQCTGRSQFRGPQLGRIKAHFSTVYPCTVPVIGADGVFYVASHTSLLAMDFSGDTTAVFSLAKESAGLESPSMMLAGGRIFIGADQGYFFATSDTSQRQTVSIPPFLFARQMGIGKDGTLYLGSNGPSLLTAVHDGAILWSKNSPVGQFQCGVMAAIAFSPDGTRLYLGTWSPSTITALDLDGNAIWSDTLGGHVNGAVAVDNDGNLFCWTSTGLVSIAPGGRTRWTIPTAAANWDVVIDNMGNVDFLMDGYLQSVTNAGVLRWKVPVDKWDFYTSLVCDAEGTVYCLTATGLPAYNLRAISRDGVIKWTLPLSAYMKWGGMALSKEGYLLITDTGSSAGITSSIYIVE